MGDVKPWSMGEKPICFHLVVSMPSSIVNLFNVLIFVSWGQLLHEEMWAWGGVDFGRMLSVQMVHMPSGEPSFLSRLVSTLTTASVLPQARPVSTSTAIFFMVWFLLTRRVVVYSCSCTGIWCIPHVQSHCCFSSCAGTLRWFCSC